MSTLPTKIAKRIRNECCYSGCTEPALDGSDFCGPHDAHERARDAGKKRRRRQKRADAGMCASCGKRKVPKRRRPDGTIIPRECSPCRKAHRERTRAVREKSRVPGPDSAVPGDSSDSRWRVEPGTSWRRWRGKGRRGRLTVEEQIDEDKRDLGEAIRLIKDALRRLDTLKLPEVMDLPAIQRAAARREAGEPGARASRILDEFVDKYG